MFTHKLVNSTNVGLAKELFAKCFPDDKLTDDENGVTCFDMSIGQKDFHYWISYDSDVDRPIGFPVGISGLYVEDADIESSWLGWFGVLPEFRRQRYGTRIINHYEDEARLAGFKYARLYTTENNAVARAFYKYAGYEEEMYHGDVPDDIGGNVVVYSKSICGNPVPPWNDRQLLF